MIRQVIYNKNRYNVYVQGYKHGFTSAHTLADYLNIPGTFVKLVFRKSKNERIHS